LIRFALQKDGGGSGENHSAYFYKWRRGPTNQLGQAQETGQNKNKKKKTIESFPDYYPRKEDGGWVRTNYVRKARIESNNEE